MCPQTVLGLAASVGACLPVMKLGAAIRSSYNWQQEILKTVSACWASACQSLWQYMTVFTVFILIVVSLKHYPPSLLLWEGLYSEALSKPAQTLLQDSTTAPSFLIHFFHWNMFPPAFHQSFNHPCFHILINWWSHNWLLSSLHHLPLITMSRFFSLLNLLVQCLVLIPTHVWHWAPTLKWRSPQSRLELYEETVLFQCKIAPNCIYPSIAMINV